MSDPINGENDRVPEDQREPFVRQVAERMPTSSIDDVRLNVDARLDG
jgi:hypothetical protein